MKLLMVKRLMMATGVAAAATIAPVVMATPASAAWPACLQYVSDHGYIVGDKVRAACNYKAIGAPWYGPNPYCYTGLVKIKVSADVALEACRRAH